ncbi:MAG: vWA domain-containing protein [Pyrinomonadaceae bacterium]
MKKLNGIVSIAASVCMMACCVVAAGAQTTGQSGEATRAAVVESQSRHEQPAVAPTEGSALIVVADTSGSVRRVLGEIKSCGKEIVASAPAGTRIGVVGINWEASKGIFADPSSASEFIDRLTTGGRYTDLGRGNDAAMSLLQEAGAKRSVVVFLTDGELQVPAGFKNRETFTAMLKREYSARPDVHVFVLNVRSIPLAGSDTLPQNVMVIPLKDWQSARGIVAESLAPQIRAQLVPPQAPQPPAPETTVSLGSHGRSLRPVYAVAGLLVAAAAAALFLALRRRRRCVEGVEPEPKAAEPENVLREEDLTPVVESNPKPEPVLILSATPGDRGARAASPRAFLRAGERLIIGKSRHLSELVLPELSQSQTLELAFDGENVEAFRLSPAAGEPLDQVRLDGGDAPIRFSWGDGERIRVGSYEVELLLADENALSAFDTNRRTGSVIVGSPPQAAVQRMPGGRLRRSNA